MSLNNEPESYIENRFRAILEQSPFSIQILSPDGFTVQVNKAWEQLWGATLEQIKGYNMLEDEQLVKKGIMPYIRRGFAGEATEIPPILYDPDETIPDLSRYEQPQRWTKAVIYPIKDAAGNVREVVLVHEDITAQKLAEEKVRVSEERYRLLFESTLDCIMVVDEQGRYVDVNESLCRKLKAEREQLIGAHFSEYMLPERLEEAKDAFTALRETGVALSQFPMRARDGSVVEFEWTSRSHFMPGLHVCFGRDMTESKRAEEALRESEARYRSLLENANDIIYSHDLQGKYLSINRAGEIITGYTREEVLNGLNIAQLIAPEHLQMAKEMTARKLRDPQPTIYEIDIINKAGRRLTLEVSTRISYDAGGVPVAVEGVARDVTERKRVEKEKAQLAEQIEAQRKHLQAMVSSVPGVVWEAWGEPDENSQRIDFVSDYVEKMLGYSVEEWLSTPNFWLTIVHPEDKERAARTAAETFKSGKPGTNQFRWIGKDGRVVWVEAQSVTIFDENGNRVGMRGVTMDITARKQKEFAEKFLAEASTTLASSLEYETTLAAVARLAVPHFADWCGVDMASEDGTLNRLAVAHIDPEKVSWAHEINRRYPPDRSAPHGIYNVLRTGESEFYPDIPEEMLVQTARDEEHLQIMRQIGFRSAMIVPLKARGKVLGVLTFVNSEPGKHHTPNDLALAEDLANRAAMAIDNAQLFRAEQQTRRNAERTSEFLKRLQAVSGSLSQALTPNDVAVAVIEQGVNSLGAHAGTVVLLNNSTSELEIVGTVGFPKEVFEKWRRFSIDANVPIADAIKRKSPILFESFDAYMEKYPALGPVASITGTQALAAFPLIIEGRTTGALGLSFPRVQEFGGEDVAFMDALAHQCAQALERARLYETEQRLRAQAETANRIKDEFLATVSHELRTPLNAIVGWSSLLMTNSMDEAAKARAIETIGRNAKAQSQIIEDLLDVSRIITGKLSLNTTLTELETVIKTALESLYPAAESKNIEIASLFDFPARFIWGDPDRLQQIMWNLLSNAIKFTPKGGRIEVSLRQFDSHIQIRVSDTGQGISQEFLPFVFDRFSQADGTSTRKYGGLGLGLAIVRHLVEMHGGTVEVDSPGLDQGTTFIVTLPVRATFDRQPAPDEALPQATEADPVAAAYPKLRGLQVLIVDDDEDARLLLTTIIEKSGASVLTAGSASEALAALADSKPHILISDIGMPGEDGYSLIRKVRARYAGADKIPAIALTAYARGEDRALALEAGFQMHIAKPVNPEELLSILKQLSEARR
ncbi:MAG: PAS domain S-box protein [Acidobacteriota bacterium]|nr:PAS domain S-box protein [Acidobacteriota bacterium]